MPGKRKTTIYRFTTTSGDPYYVVKCLGRHAGPFRTFEEASDFADVVLNDPDESNVQIHFDIRDKYA